ncbi:MAG: hypothetical protein LAO06_00810 [Acidobacteriia bacterium]|nr:hypothetical protein [Terriglobia bacterium]
MYSKHGTYIDELAFLSEEQKTSLRNLAAPTPLALESMIAASPKDFERLLGSATLEQLKLALVSMVRDEERKSISGAASRAARGFGAIVDRKAPVVPPAAYDIRRRDQLFHDIELIRKSGDSSPEARDLLQRLEAELNALFGDEHSRSVTG